MRSPLLFLLLVCSCAVAVSAAVASLPPRVGGEYCPPGRIARGGGGAYEGVVGNDDSSPLNDWMPLQTFAYWGMQPFTLKVDLASRLFPPSVRRQGRCGSCWATVAVEHAQAVIAATMRDNPLARYGTFPRFSVQQVLDCDASAADRGCGGGSVAGAWQHIAARGLIRARAYPFGQDGQQHACADGQARDDYWFTVRNPQFAVEPCFASHCPANRTKEEAVEAMWARDEQAQIPLVAYVDTAGWEEYDGASVFDATRCSSAGDATDPQAAHVVQIVGLGELNGNKFWLVRNSWGADWGMRGHILLPYGQNACGLFNYVAFVEAGSALPSQPKRRLADL